MVHTRGGHIDPSASREARPSASTPQDPSQASQALTVPSSEGRVPTSPPQCRYSTRRPPTSPPPEPSAHRVPPKRVRTSGPGETSSQAPVDSQAPGDIHIASGIAPEVIIKRPMVTAPPIPGISDCKARPFHSELYFDMEAMQQHQRIQSNSDSGPPYLSETWSAFYHEGLLEIHAYYDEHPTECIPPTPAAPSMPQATSTDPPATPPVPPAAPPLSQDFITISGSEFHGMIQQHLGIAPPQTDIPGPSEPRAPAKETIPIGETITTDVPPQATHKTALEPSCPPENPVP
ncbi:hypothetical protein CK203_058626 [Vitis vinifera]|uniref:Uncharacterized protein n=1 Tax=Vitis vinifera TaxID=29760 RepID=A0A438FTG8_VITVI|nr:hypothetical protein CK203_058626 [Vitis vinifera]